MIVTFLHGGAPPIIERKTGEARPRYPAAKV
jgi:hypothetical protein